MQHEWRWWSEESSSVLKTLLLTIGALDNPSRPLWKQQDSFQWHSSEHFVWLCYISTHISRSSCILLLCQAPGSRSHCNCRLFSPPAPRVAFKREKSFFVPEIPQIILRVPPFSHLWPFADERSWQTGGVWVDFVKVSDLFHQQSAEPRTFLELESWESRSRQLCSTADLPAFLSTSLSSRTTNHIQYKIYWEKHKCKELENIQSWVIQLAPAFPRPSSSPTRAEHYCRAGFWFDCI